MTSSGHGRGPEPGGPTTVLGGGMTVGVLSLANRVLGLARTVLMAAVAVAVLELAMPWAIGVLAPGFDADPARHGLAVALARIMVPYVLPARVGDP